MNRVAGEVRVRYMSLYTMDLEFAVQRSASADLDDIAECVAARGFTHYAIIDLLVAGF